MGRISMRDHESEVHRYKSFWSLRRADLLDDGRSLGGRSWITPGHSGVRTVEARLAPSAVRIFDLHYRALVNCPPRRPLMF